MSSSSQREEFKRPTVMQRGALVSAVLLSPVLIAQGKYVRSSIPRLPHAPEPWAGSIEGPRPLSVLGFGDSTIAGVGVQNPLHGLTAQFAERLHGHLGRGMHWRSVGRSGATTEHLLNTFLPEALEKQADVVLVSIGANDAKNLKPLGATIRRFQKLVDVLHEGHPQATLIFSSLPAFYLFKTLPEPLRTIIYQHAQAIERSVRPLIESKPFALMSPPPPGYHETFFAEDGFHPSAEGYRDWASFALSDALERGALQHLERR